MFGCDQPVGEQVQAEVHVVGVERRLGEQDDRGAHRDTSTPRTGSGPSAAPRRRRGPRRPRRRRGPVPAGPAGGEVGRGEPGVEDGAVGGAGGEADAVGARGGVSRGRTMSVGAPTRT